MGNRAIRNLRDDVTRWPTSGGEFSGLTFGTPDTFKGRWEERSELFRGADNEELTSKAVVFVAEDVSIGDYIALGDQTAVGDPTTLEGAFRVMQFSKVSDLRNVDTVRKAYL